MKKNEYRGIGSEEVSKEHIEYAEIEILIDKITEKNGLQSTFEVIYFLNRKLNELGRHVEKLIDEKNT